MHIESDGLLCISCKLESVLFVISDNGMYQEQTQGINESASFTVK